MNIKLSNIREYLRASLWFIPLLMSGLAVGAAFLMLHLDATLELDDDVTENLWLYAGGSSNAREILSTIASSMIQVAGVVFSITIVVLSLSSSQFGPRLLRTFMKDWSTQLVLGSFVATYIYCLVVLRNVLTTGDQDIVPNLSIAFAIVLTLVNILVLIYFIHHVATSIQADRVVERVDNELGDGMSRLFPETLGEGDHDRQHDETLDTSGHPYRYHLALEGHGYIQAMDNERFWQTACQNDLLIQLDYRPGQYVVSGSPVCTVHYQGILAEKLISKLQACFILGYQRTPEQDIEFSIDQLVEVALRALSPSLNDPFTAMSCIDRLCSSLSILAGRRFPSAARYSEDGILRMVATRPLTFALLFNTSFDRIRLGAKNNLAVLLKLLEAMQVLLTHCRTSEQRELVMAQAGRVMRASEELVTEAHDLERARDAMPKGLHPL